MLAHLQDSQVFLNTTESRNEELSREDYCIFLTVDTLSLLANLYFHRLMYLMIQREKLKKGCVLMKYLLLPYSVITPVVFVISVAYADLLLQVESPPSHFIGDYFCHFYEIFAHVCGLYVGSFSLFAAVFKYLFIVKSAAMKSYGEERIAFISMICYLLIPIIIAILNSFSNGDHDLLLWVNYCWGNNQSFQNIKNNDYEEVNYLSCANNQYMEVKQVGIVPSHFIISVVRTLCSSIKIMYLILFSNVPEIIFYSGIIRYLNR